ncbi:tungsten-containing aldehyde ferredoxin oxidoreductase [Heliomicrobium modesticaldum Ice1]|uniref:Tungsten-containing aldehyde ferredoxin oxidoreductase n=1 Tax=Heliobacterium modesticaldum (strain ATCC 51547 / Ice1) TaxID=498761 RepID=B0TA33_HELMI|nr:aldehyde ferredoxin oxidoreductase family protein [Heliomicrobium modesticaldum]ABZ83570.1 tungsten-containing aldehyde ferredoxin oxidoreductase [Heliomicrobium modesticaldum Ice1]
MDAYVGKVLRINLSEQTIKCEPLNVEAAKKFIGGRGLGSYLLSQEIDPAIDALSPENKVFIMTGPLTGTNAPTGGRYMVITKSPLTGAIACSNSGGFWGPELKNAGYDIVVLEGKSEKPVYISIQDDKVEIRDAAHLWGMKVNEATDRLLEEAGDPKARVLCIGPAGENLSPMAAVMNDRFRAAGRSGVGAVVGSKNVKAIVVRGSGKVQLADAERMKGILKGVMAKIRENGVTGQGLPTYGTAVLVNIINESGVFPTRNFQTGVFDDAEAISGETLAEKYLLKKDPCYRCPIACGRYTKADEMEGGGPEYETIWCFGSDCGVNDMKAIIKANHLCNEYGLDTISAGATIACAMELFEKGYIKAEEVDGPELTWGNADAIVEWTKKMGAAEGFGAKLAMGSYRLAESYGVPEYSMTVKKQELPAYDPRGIQGHGVQYATSNRGGCHVRGYMISPEILGLPEKLDRFSLEGKPLWAKIFQDLTASIDSAGMCLFTSFALGASDYADLLSAATGVEWTADEVLAAGDRIYNLERLFNMRAGLTKADDTLPKRLLEEPLPEGPSKGWVHKLDELLPLYYEARGWDADGVPTKEKLQALGLE